MVSRRLLKMESKTDHDNRNRWEGMLGVLSELSVEELLEMAWGLALLGGSQGVKSAEFKGIRNTAEGQC